MANFRASTSVNFTGDIAGSPAATVSANAFSGLTAFNDTITFRDTVIPNGTLNAFSPNSGTATQDGNVVVDINYTYTDGARVADYYVIFYKQGGGTVSPSNPCIVVNPSSGVASTARINVVPGSPYTFAFSSARVTKDGVRASSPQNQTSRTVVTGNYTGSVNGTGAATVVTNAGNGATAFSGTAKYRTAGAPTNLVVPTGITVTTNSNATKTIRVSWDSYVQGANQADVIGLFYRKDNNIPTYTDSCIVMNVNVNTPAYYDFFGVNPTDPYSFGIAAGRRTENGVEWGLINTTYGTSTWYLYGPDLAVQTISPNGVTVSPSTDYTPNGEVTNTITDNSSTIFGGANLSSVTGLSIPTTERWFAETFVKDTTATNILSVFRVYASETSYGQITFNRGSGALVGTYGPASPPTEGFIETITVNGQDWYRIGVTGSISPGYTTVLSTIYPAIYSPGAPAWSPDFTGAITMGPVSIRKLTNASTGFDWTAITADAAANFTGNLAGSPATTIVSNANNAFTGTTKYRTAGAPTNLPVPTNIVSTTNSNASKNITIYWDTYTQGTNQADFLVIYWRKDNNTPTYFDNSVVVAVNTGQPSFWTLEGVPPDQAYSFGIAAGRRTESGTELTSINTTFGYTGSPQYIYNESVTVPNFNSWPASNASPVASTNIAPNGLLAYTLADDSAVAYENASYTTSVASPGLNSVWQTEWWVKRDPTANNIASLRTFLTGSSASPDQLLEFKIHPGTGSIYAGASGTNTSLAYYNVETISDYTSPSDVTWYRVIYAGSVSAYNEPVGNPISNILLQVYPSVGNYSPGNSVNNAFSPDATGSITVVPGGLRKINRTISPDKDWTNITANTVNYTANINGVAASTVTTAVNNFNTANDQNGSVVTAPTTNNTSADITSVLNQNNTIDLTVNWNYSPATANFNTSSESIDGFIVYLRSFPTSQTYTLSGASPETQYVVPISQRTFTIPSLPSDKWYHAGIRAYRVVNKTVNSAGVIVSSPTTETTAYPNGYIAASQFPIGVTKTFSSSTAPYNNKFTTDVYTDAYWTQANASPSLSSPSILTPDGITQSYALIENSAVSANHNIQKAGISFTAGKWAIVKALIKAKSGDRGAQLRLSAGAFTALKSFTFRFDTLLTTSTAGTYSSVKKLSNDWYQITGIAQVDTTATSTVVLYLYDHATSNVAYTGNGTSGIYFSNFTVYEVDSLPDLSGTPYDTVGDTWYNPSTLDYKTWNGSQWVQSATYGATFGSDTSNISGLSGDGINRVLARFSGGFNAVEYDNVNSSNKYIIFPVTKDSGSSPVCSIISGNGVTGPTSGFYGTKAIKIYDNSGVGNRTVYFSSSSTNYNMPIDPNSKWILSSKMWCGSPANVPLPITMGVRTATSPTTGYTATQNITVKQTWQDFAGTLNLSNDSSDAGLLFIKVNSSPSTSPAVYFDGLMLEKQVGPGTTPSKWVKSTKIGISGTSGNSAVAPGDLGIGSVLPGLTMNQGDGTLRPVLNGLLLGYARDGDVVSFSPAYSIVPTVIWLPGAKVTATSIPANASATYEATGLTTTGFTAKLKLTGLSGTPTTVTETFGSGGASNSVISPSGGGANITADYVINKGNSASEAWDDKYTYKYNVSITNTGPDAEGVYEPGEITVAGYARIATGWVQVFTNTHSGGFSAASTTRTINTTFTLDGVIQSPTAGQYEFAIDKVYNPNDVGGGITAFTSVTYATATAPTQISATESTSYAVPYIVIANTTGV